MATSVDSVNESSDFVKDYSCDVCESKNIETSADIFCETCLKCFCQKCFYHHDQMFVNHSTYGRGETHKWPLTKAMEDLLLKCEVHNNKKLQMFCQDHSQLCCSDCVFRKHRPCTNLALISESLKKLTVDRNMLSNKIQTIIAELNKFKRTKEASIHSVEGSYSQKLQEIRDLRKKLNSDLDELENSTLKELDEIRTILQTSLKKDVDNCSRLEDKLQQLSEAVHGLSDTSKKDIEFIAARKCLDKIHESESYLEENPVEENLVQSSMTFQANIDTEQYLSTQYSLARIVDSLQFLTLKTNPDEVLTVKRMSHYNVKISSGKIETCCAVGICSLPSGHVIVIDQFRKKVKLFDQYYNVSSHCNMSDHPWGVCQITSNEVAVTLSLAGVQFMSVSNGQLVNGRELQLTHAAVGIAHHQGALYINSRTALYHYTLTGALVKKRYETRDGKTVLRCALSPAGDRIYVTRLHELLTLATDGSPLFSFTDPELIHPRCVNVTPAGQVLVCGQGSNTVLQVDREGKKKLATLFSGNEGAINPVSVCYNTNNQQIIVGLYNNNKIYVMELQ